MNNNQLEMEQRVQILEREVDRLLKQLNLQPLEEEVDVKRNEVSQYTIKMVYPGIYRTIDSPVAGFPKNRRKLTERIEPGGFMFLYVTSPEKKIIGLTRVKDYVQITSHPRWPYVVPLEFVVGPKSIGVTFQDVGLDIRPRVGDTLFSISPEKAQEIIEMLKVQPDLEPDTLQLLIRRYEHLDEVEHVKITKEDALRKLRESKLNEEADYLEKWQSDVNSDQGWDAHLPTVYPHVTDVIWGK